MKALVETMNTNSEQYLKEFEAQIKNAQPALAMGKSLASLLKNGDFKKVFLEGYLKDEAVRLVLLKADPAMQKPEAQAAVIRDIDSIGALHMYLHTVAFNGKQAEGSVNEAQQGIVEIENEAK